MSTKVPHNNEDQEIDLAQISKKIGNFFDRISASVFRTIQFFIHNWIIVLILVVAGFGIGMFLDKTQKSYDNQVIVKPNFGSVDYLYSKVDLIQSKIQIQDTVFFKSIGISGVPKLTKISIEPIVDVFKFVNNNEQNLEVLKLITANGDLKSVIKETTTTKNYPYYIITFSTKGLSKDGNLAKALLNYINSSKYYADIQKISINNIRQKIKQNEEIVSQIDGILLKISSSGNANQDKLVYNNENMQLNDIIKTKDELLRENANFKVDLITSDKIVKDSSVVTNMESTSSIKGRLKIILPVLFVLIYLFSLRSVRFYKKQAALDKIKKS
ncbi:hypothetical protein GON26_05465 [Flavobacterium sp. GA093]|uniref:Chain length determinant protein n=1 Tax=Flavobacterium hydrocarbonoxydans TaxID=2683249 RepID=A0A6I4NQ37_9FLAO|nr:hypothetical protein [Flavobacterium hydrocarbonoxydans]MWB93799.1 hypothetical protein [Flavobacterium hydrocarbonoxydans]